MLSRILPKLRAVSLASLSMLTAAVLAQVNVTTYHNSNYRTGLNNLERVLIPANVNPTNFGLLFTLPVDGFVYAQPLYLSHVTIPGKGVHNVVFVATEHDSVYAFDANSNDGANAQPLWHVSLGTSVPNGDTGTDDIVPEVGITGTPVIVPAPSGVSGATATLFVVAKTKGFDASNNPVYAQKLHALDVTTGAERAHSPVVIQGTVKGTGEGSDGLGHLSFNPLIGHNRAALTVLSTNGVNTIYVPFASHGDNGPYHGWIFAYNADTLAMTGIFNTTPNALTDPSGYPLAAGGIWQGGAGPASDGFNLFFATGNGTFNHANGSYGDSILRVPVKTLTVADYFTPSDQQNLDDSDADLGSGGVMLLPTEPSSPPTPALLVQAGKEGTIYLIRRAALGKYNAVDHVLQELPQVMGGIWGAPAYFNGNLYYGPIYSPLVAFSLKNGAFTSPGPTAASPDGFGYPGPTPSVSSNGLTNGIVWAIQSDGYSSGGPAYLRAYAASNIGIELYNSADTSGRDALGGAVKFSVPTVVNGKVYVGTSNSVGVFGLGQWAAQPSITPSSGNYAHSVTVTMSDSTAGASIYYTTDGSIPTKSSALYSGPVTFTTSVTIKARAFAPGYGGSASVEADYQIDAVIGTGIGLIGQYYNNSQNPVGTPTTTRLDPSINFNWNGSPPVNLVGGSNWAGQWVGTVEAECTTTYTFYTNSDDGVQLFVSGRQIINDWSYHGPTIDQGTIALQGGVRYSIVIDFFQGGGGSVLQLFWSAPGMPMQIVPTSQLYPARFIQH